MFYFFVAIQPIQGIFMLIISDLVAKMTEIEDEENKVQIEEREVHS